MWYADHLIAISHFHTLGGTFVAKTVLPFINIRNVAYYWIYLIVCKGTVR